MAKKTSSKPMQAAAPVERTTKPVRLDVPLKDVGRLEAAATRLGLSMSAYARMALFERLERDEKK